MPEHTCHLPGCSTGCPPRHLFCRKHWAMVPKDLQREVYDTVGQRCRSSVDSTWAPWWRAQAEATAAVLVRLHPVDFASWIQERLKHAHEFADKLEGRGSP